MNKKTLSTMIIFFVLFGAAMLFKDASSLPTRNLTVKFINGSLHPESTREYIPTPSVTDEEKAVFINACSEAAQLYEEIYRSSEIIVSQNFGVEDYLAQKDIDKIEDVFIDTGYPIINTNSLYPEYLENSDGLYSFWADVTANKNAETAFWGVSSTGGLYLRWFQYFDGKAYAISASSKWNEKCQLELAYIEKREIYNWDMTFNQDFYYQDLALDWHWTASKLVRLHPVDEKLYDLCREYIAPIGYHNVNLFLLDWDSENYGNLCFNDVLSSLYKIYTGNSFTYENYEFLTTPFSYYEIPADTFEEVILNYFDISLEQLRSKALYDPVNDAYPWQLVTCSNVLYFPSVIPDVIDCVEMEDGTLKLTVNVMCLDYHTDRLFVHEVSLKPLPDGSGYQYAGNKIVYTGDVALPSPQTRIPTQRFTYEGETIAQ